MPAEIFARRMELIKNYGYSVLGLRTGLELLQAGDLPPRGVTITFDDGTYDFYKHVYPRAKDSRYPVYNLICSYMLWKRRGVQLPAEKELSNDVLLRAGTQIFEWGFGQLIERYGRHEETRTPDLYRVKVAL
jgi:hypothetical protein